MSETLSAETTARPTPPKWFLNLFVVIFFACIIFMAFTTALFVKSAFSERNDANVIRDALASRYGVTVTSPMWAPIYNWSTPSPVEATVDNTDKWCLIQIGATPNDITVSCIEQKALTPVPPKN